ncbi:helix-turn-helix domain-containing protein [Psychrobacillus antarcticus]|uniref:helix-turn-helix domain-containing protein n=1 Tax=Psychrobacillus antarcticus TaxID=2879115 RepID=UPI00387E9EE4
MAAEKLGISQSTLSHQIKKREQEIGYALLNRIHKKTSFKQSLSSGCQIEFILAKNIFIPFYPEQ